MIYEVYNKPERIEIALLDEAISFACDYLHVDIDVVLEFKKLKKHVCGFCDYEGDDVVITLSRRLNTNDVVRTLFHEMVHVKQHHDGRLVHGRPSMWMGVPHTEIYENLPWELEAFDLENKMVELFSVDNYTSELSTT